MNKEEELINSELKQDHEGDENKGDEYEDEHFDENNNDVDEQMDGDEGEYDQEAQADMHNPYNQNNIIRNTFYPPQNPAIGPGFGGALRPVSANVMKDK
jgi:hypothetical protein